MVRWHPSRLLLASAGYDDVIFIWEQQGEDWGSKFILNGHVSTVWGIDWKDDVLISCSDDCSIKLWEY